MITQKKVENYIVNGLWLLLGMGNGWAYGKGLVNIWSLLFTLFTFTIVNLITMLRDEE